MLGNIESTSNTIPIVTAHRNDSRIYFQIYGVPPPSVSHNSKSVEIFISSVTNCYYFSTLAPWSLRSSVWFVGLARQPEQRFTIGVFRSHALSFKLPDFLNAIQTALFGLETRDSGGLGASALLQV